MHRISCNYFAPLQVPILDWIYSYNKTDFLNDLSAGFMVFIIYLPINMSCAILAGMPPIYGIYTSVAPSFIYALLGTSRQLSIGPNAIIPLLLYQIIIQSFPSVSVGSDEYVQIIMNMTMIVGLIMMACGFFNLGGIFKFLNNNVLTGFVTASGINIFLSNLKFITGINVPHSMVLSYQLILYYLENIKSVHLYPMLIGIFTMIILYICNIWKKNIKIRPNYLHISLYYVVIIFLNLIFLLVVVAGSIIDKSA